MSLLVARPSWLALTYIRVLVEKIPESLEENTALKLDDRNAHQNEDQDLTFFYTDGMYPALFNL